MQKMPKAVRREKALRMIEKVGLGGLESRNIAQLSGGQRQRVGLARALVVDPAVLLLDEPLGSLDANLKVAMQSELKALQRELGLTFVYVTHNQSEAIAMADRIAVMNAGRIEQLGTPQEIYRSPRTRFVAEFVGTNNIVPGRVAAVEGDTVRVEAPSGTYAVASPAGAPSVGTAVTFVIPADRVDVDAGGIAVNVVEASVRGEEYLGSGVTFMLETDDGSLFKASKAQTRGWLGLPLNQRVTLQWAPDDAFLLPWEDTEAPVVREQVPA
jgi:spermidine/putrescine transport system ATP-binding protein